MDSYSTTITLAEKREAVRKALDKAVRKGLPTKRLRKAAIERAATTMPLVRQMAAQ